jgi:catechol 2,3-dioxygenase-like lactoylglutathione lyase family enzyme
MLNNRSAYATIPASDFARAKSWYQVKLGLKPSWEGEPGALYDMPDGSGFLLYPTEHASKAPNTLMTFSSDNVEGDVAALKELDVAFLDIDEGGLKTVNAVASFGDLKAAWFKDSEGNILAIGNKPA